MGIIGIRLSETEEFYSTKDTKEPRTKWVVGILDSEVFAALGAYAANPLKMMFEIVRFGLKGFENFTDSKGNKVEFDTVSQYIGGPVNYKVVSSNIMKIIPHEVINELGEKILSLSKINEEETKN